MRAVQGRIALGVVPTMLALLLAGVTLCWGLDLGGGEKDAYLGLAALCWAPLYICAYGIGLWRRWRPARAASIAALVASILLIPAALILLRVLNLLR